MTARFSTYLDGLRFITAIVVLLSHFAYQRFSGGDYLALRELNLGSDAVVLFFVLSGFVIAYAGFERDRSAGQFLFKRATRLYSVAAPALLLTIALDFLGNNLASHAYGGWWYSGAPLQETLFYGLTFSNEWINGPFRVGTNGPYWSLSYEAGYYILFAIAIYLTGLKRLTLLLICIVVLGLNILLLLPCWLFGVALYRVVRNGSPISTPGQFVLIWLPPAMYCLFLLTGVSSALKVFTAQHLFAFPIQNLRFSDEFLWNWLIGLLFAAHLLGMSQYLISGKTATGQWRAKAIKWAAGASFSIYLIHYPTMQFLSAIIPLPNHGLLNQALLLIGTIGICFIFAQYFERPLPSLRRHLLLCQNWMKMQIKSMA